MTFASEEQASNLPRHDNVQYLWSVTNPWNTDSFRGQTARAPNTKAPENVVLDLASNFLHRVVIRSEVGRDKCGCCELCREAEVAVDTQYTIGFIDCRPDQKLWRPRAFCAGVSASQSSCSAANSTQLPARQECRRSSRSIFLGHVYVGGGWCGVRFGGSAIRHEQRGVRPNPQFQSSLAGTNPQFQRSLEFRSSGK